MAYDAAQQVAAEQAAVAAPVRAPAAPAAPSQDDLIAKLQQLGQLHASGILSDDEFAQAKAKLLA